MKFLQVTNSRLPSTDANAVQVTAMASALAERAQVVLTANRQGDASDDEIRRMFDLSESVDLELDIRAGAGWSETARYVGRMRRLVRRERPSMAYGRDPIGLFAAATAGLPVIYEIHQPAASRTRELVERTLFRSSRIGLVFITESLRDWYLAHGHVPERMPSLVLADGATPPVRDSKVPPPRRRRVGYFGSLHEGKGIQLITDLGRLLPDVEFDVFGGQPTQVEHWKSRQRSEGVQLHGWIPHSDVRKRMEEMDVLLAPYGNESYGVGGSVDISRFMSPLKVFEYMAARRPIVASDLPVLREILDDGRTALLCPPSDLTCWTDAVQTVLDEPDFADGLAAAAFDDLCDRFSWSSRAAALIEFTERI